MIIWSIPWIKFWHYQIKFFWYLNSFFILWFQYFDQNNSLAVKYFRYFRYLLVTRALLIRLSVVFFSFYERCWIFLSPRHSVIRFWQNVPKFGPPLPPHSPLPCLNLFNFGSSLPHRTFKTLFSICFTLTFNNFYKMQSQLTST